MRNGTHAPTHPLLWVDDGAAALQRPYHTLLIHIHDALQWYTAQNTAVNMMPIQSSEEERATARGGFDTLSALTSNKSTAAWSLEKSQRDTRFSTDDSSPMYS